MLQEHGLTREQYDTFAEAEEFILTVTENGFGKRTSAFEYRITGRGGQGITNIDTGARNGLVVASFPVSDVDQVMLISNAGQIIRMGVHDIRIAGRSTQGVTLFRTASDESVVSVAHLPLDGTEADENDTDTEDGADSESPEAGDIPETDGGAEQEGGDNG